MKRKIYISGKITGIEKAATLLFKQGAEEVRVIGHVSVNPCELPRKHDKSWQSYMREAIKALCDCDGIYMLSNWRSSKGATIELKIAMALGLEIIYQQKDWPAHLKDDAPVVICCDCQRTMITAKYLPVEQTFEFHIMNPDEVQVGDYVNGTSGDTYLIDKDKNPVLVKLFAVT